MENYRITTVTGASVSRFILADVRKALRLARAAAKRRGETIELWRRSHPGAALERIAAFRRDGTPISLVTRRLPGQSELVRRILISYSPPPPPANDHSPVLDQLLY